VVTISSHGTLWLLNIAMESGPFIDDFPFKTSIYKGFSMAMLKNHMVVVEFSWGLPEIIFQTYR